MLSALRKAREAYELGRLLQAAIERGRKLHPWRDRRHSIGALVNEMHELRIEVAAQRERRIQDEALDVAVVALRIRAGA